MQYDSWHTLEISEYGATVGGHERCPTRSNGPSAHDIGYGCLTYANIRGVAGRRYPEVDQLGYGAYEIRYWWSEDDTDGYEVRAT